MRLRTFVFLLVASLAPAQQAGVDAPPSPPFEGRTVSRVDFLPEEQPLPREELDKLLPVRPGAPLRMAEVRDAIQKLYETGRFEDISADAAADGEGVAVTFTTSLTYFVSRVSIRGENEPPNRNQLATAAQLELGAPFREENIVAAADRIQDRLRANGLYQSSLQQHVDLTGPTEEASIYFDVTAGKRAHFDGVEITSLQPITEQTRQSLIRATDWRRGIAFLPLPGWRPFTENRLQEGLDNVRKNLQKNDRLQASVKLDRLDYNAESNRVTPVLSIDSGPVIEVKVLGADVSRTKLRELIPIYQERTVDNSLLREGQRNLQEHMQSEGYFDAVVRYTESEPAPGRSVIEYQIEKGTQHTLRSIVIGGNSYFDTATLRERMVIRAASLLRFRSGRYSPRLLSRDVEAVRALYQTNGFRDVMVVPEVVEDPLRHTDISVHLQITEGRQWLVNKLTITGVGKEDEEYLRGLLRSTENQPFSAANVAADRDSVLTYFFNDGYPNADFAWTQTPGPSEGLEDLVFVIQPGERQYVRGVLVRGLETTDPGLVFSRISLKAADPLSQSQISETQQRLYDLGIFAKVQTATQNPDGIEASKYVILHVDEARKYSLNLGVGAEIARIGGSRTSLTSPAGATGFAPRVSVGISRINFLGLGHTVSLQTLVSTLQRRALLNYVAPQFKGNPDMALTFSALFNDARDVRTFSARRWEGSVQLSQRFSRALNGQMRVTFRRVTLDQNSLKISQNLIGLLNRPVRVGLVAGTIFRDRRDDPVESHRGSYNSLDVGLATKFLASQTSYTRLVVRNSTYHPLRRDMVLARSVQFGLVERFAGLPEIPLTERFFSGGASSHRGFPDNQAGPRDPITGFPLGGSALLFHSTELRFPLIGDDIGGVLFHDMGNVYSNVDQISFRVRQKNLQDFDYMVHAVGAGIRYRTPVGPLRVDMAYGPNSPRFFGFSGSQQDLINLGNVPLCEDSSPQCVNQRINRFQFHFSLGQTF